MDWGPHKHGSTRLRQFRARARHAQPALPALLTCPPLVRSAPARVNLLTPRVSYRSELRKLKQHKTLSLGSGLRNKSAKKSAIAEYMQPRDRAHAPLDACLVAFNRIIIPWPAVRVVSTLQWTSNSARPWDSAWMRSAQRLPTSGKWQGGTKPGCDSLLPGAGCAIAETTHYVDRLHEADAMDPRALAGRRPARPAIPHPHARA